jgi:hypothetical protein
MLDSQGLKKILLVAILFASIPSFSDELPGVSPSDVKWTIQHLVVLDGPTANCSTTGSCEGTSAPSQACISAYDRLYEPGKENLNFRVFIGYWDTQPEPGAPGVPKVERQDWVIDSAVKKMFSEILTKPCDANLFACGFSHELEDQDTDELEHLAKVVPGPDGNDRTVHLTLESSSVSKSNHENQHQGKAEQKAQTKKVTDDFFDSIGRTDALIYIGHSRWGTGPGFKPLPPLSWSWIDAGVFKPSRRRLDKALKNAQEKPALIGYFSCTSEKYYEKYFEKDAPETGLALTTNVFMTDLEAQEAALGTLNALLGLQCEDDFTKTLQFRKDNPGAETLEFFRP